MPHIACHIQVCKPAASLTGEKNVVRHRAAVCCCIDWRTEGPKGAFETSCASMRKNMTFTIYMTKNICGNCNGQKRARRTLQAHACFFTTWLLVAQSICSKLLGCAESHLDLTGSQRTSYDFNRTLQARARFFTTWLLVTYVAKGFQIQGLGWRVWV